MALTLNLLPKFKRKRQSKKPEDLLERSKAFCMAPWPHIHVLPTGKIYTCCMSAHLEKECHW